MLLSRALEKGQPVVIGSTVGADHGSFSEHLIDRQIYYNKQGQLCILVGDKPYTYHDKFKAMLWTRRNPPSFPSDVIAKTSTINFSISKEQLVDQLVQITLKWGSLASPRLASPAYVRPRRCCLGGIAACTGPSLAHGHSL